MISKRKVWGEAMGNLWHDLRYGARMLFKNKGFAAVAIIALALGIGANTAIFSVVNAVLLRPLPFKSSERLVALRQTSTQRKDDLDFASYPNFTDWRTQNKVFEQLAVFRNINRTLTGADQPVRLQSSIVSANLFQLLGATPGLGRAFLPEEDMPGANSYAVILSHGLWQRRFGSDPKVLGRNLTLSGKSYTIVGVMPDGFQFPVQAEPTELWITVALDAETPVGGGLPNTAQRGVGIYQVIGRLKPNVTLEQAQTEMNLIARNLETQYPNTNTHQGVKIIPQLELLVGKIRTALLILFGAVGFVLLISCANVANLLLARATTRHKEMAIRAALGASRWRVVRQLLTESVLLGLAGGALGLLLAMWGTDLLIALSPKGLPRLNEIGLDGRVLGFTMFVSLLTGAIFGLAPALHASKLDLTESLKEGGRSGATGARGNRVRNLLIVSEVALALMLLIGAGLLARSFLRLQRANPGFNAEHVLALKISLPSAKYSEPQEAMFFKQLLARVKTLPGVADAGIVWPLPLGGDQMEISFEVAERPVAEGERPSSEYRSISPDYFHTMSIPLLKGRDFTTRDDMNAPGVVIVNETLARQIFPGEDPIGKRIKPGISVGKDQAVMREIVGVVGDVKHQSLSSEAGAEVYVPHAQVPFSGMALVARTAVDPQSLAATMRNEVSKLDKDIPVYNIRTLDDYLAASVAQPRFNTLLLGIFAGVALFLTMIGLYGVISYSVTQRTHEIGIRVALGAQTSDVLKLVVKQGMALALIGVGVGLLAALALTRVLASLLYGVSATDPVTFGGVSLLLVAVALLACLVPARRAMKVDPMIALRYE